MRLFLFIVVIFPCICFGQSNADSLFFATISTYSFSKDCTSKSISALPFKNIEIWDARGDTSSVGFIELSNAQTKRLNYKEGLSATIKQCARSYYHFANGINDTVSLIAIIKTYRFSDLSDETDKKYDLINYGLLLSAELFLFNGKGYHALYKVDSTIIFPVVNDLVSAIPADVFKTLFAKAENKSLSELHIGKTEFTLQQMQNHVEMFNSYPILKDSVLNKGVYLTFVDFKNNKPAFEDYIINQKKNATFLYKVTSGPSNPLTNYWGYCDGKNIFYNDNGFVSLLLRAGNTFNTISIQSVARKRKLISLNGATTALSTIVHGSPFFFQGDPSKTTIKKGAFQLDMQTGILY